jgi:hypothetical protein
MEHDRGAMKKRTSKTKMFFDTKQGQWKQSVCDGDKGILAS